MILENRDLRDQALDEILQVLDQTTAQILRDVFLMQQTVTIAVVILIVLMLVTKAV